MLRGHDADHDLRAVQRGVQIAGRCNRFRQDDPRQEVLIDSVSGDALGNFQFVCPEMHLVSSFPSEDDCKCGAPGACTDDGNAAHLRDAPNVSDFAPNSVPGVAPSFDSVPVARRPIFCRCFQMTSAETTVIKISCRESTYSWRAHASSGKAAATATDPSET